MGGNCGVKGFVDHLKGVKLCPICDGKVLKNVSWMIHKVRRYEKVTK